MTANKHEPGDSVQHVEQLLRPLPEHWIVWLKTTTTNFLQKVNSEMKEHEEMREFRNAEAGLHTQRWPGESAYIINGQTVDRAISFLRLVDGWITLSPHERDETVRKYARAWTMHVITQNVPSRVPLVPRHIKFFATEDYARMTKFIDDYQAAVTAANHVRKVYDWVALPNNLIKVLLEGTFRSECRGIYEPFFDAYLNDSLKDEV